VSQAHFCEDPGPGVHSARGPMEPFWWALTPPGMRWSRRGFTIEVMLQPSEIAPERVRPLRRTEYDLLVVAGAFEGERLELLSGALVEMTLQGTRHSESVARLCRLLTRGLPDQYVVRAHSPFAATDDSEPEPDLAVVPDEDYSARHPSTAFLVVEGG